MSLLKTNSVQIGQSATATENFTVAVPSSPDGTVKLARGNSGATTADLIAVDASGNVGIGTTSPSSKLHVAGDLTVSSATTSTSATAGSYAVPANAVGFLSVTINGTVRKIPFFA